METQILTKAIITLNNDASRTYKLQNCLLHKDSVKPLFLPARYAMINNHILSIVEYHEEKMGLTKWVAEVVDKDSIYEIKEIK